MVANASLTRSDSMRKLLDEIGRELIITDIDHGDGLIALPEIYPGGSSVVVRIRRDRDNYIVTDQGNGYSEAERLGGAPTFVRVAPSVAQLHGVKFDSHMLFAMEVSREWLANAIIFTAAASRKAVEITAERMAEERETTARQVFRDHLRDAFGDKAEFDVPFRGRSTKEWKFGARVFRQGHLALFDLVTPHHVSINSTIVKFQDIAALDESISNVVVLADKARMESADVDLLSRSAKSVIPLTADKITLLRVA